MMLALDIETYEFNEKENTYEPILDARKFTIGCAITDKGTKHYFYTPKEMYQWLDKLITTNSKNNKRTFIYGHNIEYDWYGIAQGNLLNKETKYINFNPFIAIHKEKGYILDTMAFYRMSLQTIGEILKFPKLEMPKKIKNIEELKPYVTRDVEITLAAITELKKKINTLGFKPRKLLTAGQLAMTSFLTYINREKMSYTLQRYNEKTKRKEVIKTNYEKEIREAYRGGNNTAFQIGTFNNVTLIDIVALYTKAMHDMEFPDLTTEQKIEQPTTGMLKAYTEKYLGIAQITINAPNIPTGYLPIRYGGHQLFPTNNKLKGTWTFLEIKKALQLGYTIETCDYCIRWKKQEKNPLKEFVKHLHELEKECKTKEEKSPLKLIRNNLYGKFAQNKTNKDYKIIFREEIEQFIYEGYKVVASQDNKYIIVKEGIPYKPSYVNPIISTLITAYARNYLYDRITKIPKEDLLYCDTDSIMFKGNHLKEFEIGNEMGMFKVEDQGKAKILGEKRYYINQSTRISGVPKREIKKTYIENEENIIIKRMCGIGTGIKIGNINEIGSFREINIEMKPHRKIDIPIPTFIDEVGIANGGK